MISFERYCFLEGNGELIVKVASESNLREHLRRYEVSLLVQEYIESIVRSDRYLDKLQPELGRQALAMFDIWRSGKFHENHKRLLDPISALQEEVAQMCFQLFKQFGRAYIVIGCMHVHGRIYEAGTGYDTSFPQKSAVNECHDHKTSVTVDMRTRPGKPEYSFPYFNTEKELTSESPTLVRNILVDWNDLSRVRDVDEIYVERVPTLEMGPNQKNSAFFQWAYKALRPSGRLVFDYNWSSEFLTENEAVYGKRAQEVPQEVITEYARQLSLDDQTRTDARRVYDDKLSMERLCHFNSYFVTGSFGEFLGTYASVNAQIFFKKAEEKARRNDLVRALKNITNVDMQVAKLKKIILFIRYNEDESQMSAPILVFKVGQGFSRREELALIRQVSMYQCASARGNYSKNLLAENKDLLDQFLTEQVAPIVLNNLARVGFSVGEFKLDAPNPENGRKLSRLIVVTKS